MSAKAEIEVVLRRLHDLFRPGKNFQKMRVLRLLADGFYPRSSWLFVKTSYWQLVCSIPRPKDIQTPCSTPTLSLLSLNGKSWTSAALKPRYDSAFMPATAFLTSRQVSSTEVAGMRFLQHRKKSKNILRYTPRSLLARKVEKLRLCLVHLRLRNSLQCRPLFHQSIHLIVLYPHIPIGHIEALAHLPVYYLSGSYCLVYPIRGHR